MKNWTIKDLKKNLAININGYNEAICVEYLCIKLYGVKGSPYVKGLSGAQFEIAKSVAESLPAPKG